MPRLLQQQQAALVHFRRDVIALLRQRTPAEQHVDFVQRARRVLHRAQVGRGGRAQLQKQLVLQLPRAFLRTENLRLHLLELRRDEALGVGQRLLARVIGRRRGEVRRADLDVITEDLIVTHLERLDPGALLLPPLEISEPVLAFDRRGTQLFQPGVMTRANEAAFL